MSSKFNNCNNQNQQQNQNQNQNQQQNQQQNQKQNKKNNNFNNQKTKTIFKKKIRHCGKFAMPCFLFFQSSKTCGFKIGVNKTV